MKKPKFSSLFGGRRLRSLLPQNKKQKTHRLSAQVTGEDDWEVDEPQIRMSRAFAVMLVLHLVAVGGLFAFHMFGKDEPVYPVARPGIAGATAPRIENPAPSAPAPAVSPAATPVPAAAPPRAEIVMDDEELPAPGVKQHVFKQGESKLLIATVYKISVRELEEANSKASFKPGETLIIPDSQRIIGSASGPVTPENPPLDLVDATSGEEVGYREFALKDGADNPYAPVTPEELGETSSGNKAMNTGLQGGRTGSTQSKPEVAVAYPPGEAEDGDGEEFVLPPATPVRKSAPAPEAAPAPRAKPATGSRTHVVQKGDTIYNVARRHGLSPDEVMRANKISDPSKLQLGQVLKITVKR